MAPLSASLTLRPTRIGFLTRPDDLESLRRIFQVCTCLWGGIYSPIIPVCQEIPESWKRSQLTALNPIALAKGYIRFFEPDVFVECQEGLAKEIGLEVGEIDFGHSRLISLEAFFTEEREHRRGGPPFGTSIFHLYKSLYEQEFKFLPKHERNVAVMATDTEDAAFVECCFGGFPQSGPLASLAASYVEAFDPVSLPATPDNWQKVFSTHHRLPLIVTRERLEVDHSGWDEPTLFVVDSTNPIDLIDLWNIRLFRSQVMPVNLAWLKDTGNFLQERLKANYRPLPGNLNGVMIHPTIHIARSISEERARAAIAEAGLLPTPGGGFTWSLKTWYDGIWREQSYNSGPRLRRRLVSVDSTNLELTGTVEESGLRFQFKGLAPDFADTYGEGAARWVNVLNFQNYGQEDTLALTLPTALGGNTTFRMRLGEATIVSREGFVLPQRFKGIAESFRLFSGREVIIEWLKTKGIGAAVADPGRVTDQILSSIGGFWGIRLIADRRTLQLLDRMSKSTTIYDDGKTEEFPERSVEVKQWKDLVNRRANEPFTGNLSLDDFVKKNILRLGLLLDCPNCFKRNWYGIDGLGTSMRCERCLKDFSFPEGSLTFDRTPWHYRVVGPFSVPNYAAGAYATALALNTFARDLGGERPNVTYATNLDYKVGEEKSFEVDFTLWYQQKHVLDLGDEPVLVFGEAKSFALESFKTEDVARMRKLGEKFPGAFLVFATLKDELSETERALITELAQWGRTKMDDGRSHSPVIILTGTELFARWDIRDAWKNAGERYQKFREPSHFQLSNLAELARMTQEIYLNIPYAIAPVRLTPPDSEPASPVPIHKEPLNQPELNDVLPLDRET